MNDINDRWCLKLFILEPTGDHIQEMVDSLVRCTVEVYDLITNQLLPTPAKSHYTFNLRDLAKVFQGMLMMEISSIQVCCFIFSELFS